MWSFVHLDCLFSFSSALEQFDSHLRDWHLLEDCSPAISFSKQRILHLPFYPFLSSRSICL
jgi:hypothetical protein